MYRKILKAHNVPLLRFEIQVSENAPADGKDSGYYYRFEQRPLQLRPLLVGLLAPLHLAHLGS